MASEFFGAIRRCIWWLAKLFGLMLLFSGFFFYSISNVAPFNNLNAFAIGLYECIHSDCEVRHLEWLISIEFYGVCLKRVWTIENMRIRSMKMVHLSHWLNLKKTSIDKWRNFTRCTRFGSKRHRTRWQYIWNFALTTNCRAIEQPNNARRLTVALYGMHKR